ncbi:MAG: hypothetical protein QOF99_2866 [Pseudonocardiales bacterium]|nr:hypothetical protein [Pseudonocardiales bacterium]
MPAAGTRRAYPPATFTDPTPYGYLYAGFTVDPPRRVPVVRRSRRRDEAIARIAALARRFDDLPQVVKATVFRAVFMPPVKGAPRFDVALLVRTTSPEALADIRATEPYAQLGADSVITAANSRRIGVTEPFAPDAAGVETDAFTSASYLFNHFATRTGPPPRGRASPAGSSPTPASTTPPCSGRTTARRTPSSTTSASRGARSPS